MFMMFSGLVHVHCSIRTCYAYSIEYLLEIFFDTILVVNMYIFNHIQWNTSDFFKDRYASFSHCVGAIVLLSDSI